MMTADPRGVTPLENPPKSSHCSPDEGPHGLRNLFIEMGLGHLVSEPTIMLGDKRQAGRWARTEMIGEEQRKGGSTSPICTKKRRDR